MPREAGLHEITESDGWTSIAITGVAGDVLWASRLRTALLDADTRGMLQTWASAQLRREMRADPALELVP